MVDPSAESRPNVLLITVDQWAASMLGIEGGRLASTPTLDYLAGIGTRYTRAYSECPVCIPARRSLMTGTSPRVHGDREFKPTAPMPHLQTLAGAFTAAGYQAFAAGKLHVYPQRDRIGFDDVILMEEGRAALGALDDYDLFLGERGLAGQQYAHGMTNNDYVSRPWHLPEEYHPTSWLTQQMVRLIKRRDPTRPAFWYLSYPSPHPPLTPLASYLERYRDVLTDLPIASEWSSNDELPYALRCVREQWPTMSDHEIQLVRRAVYALATHIDHQLRVVIGTLREEGLLEETVIMFTADHGDMLGDHNLWAKRLFYEGAARIPLILVGTEATERVRSGVLDDRLVALRDVMPTLLDLTGIAVPAEVDGITMLSEEPRDRLYGEFGCGATATRMMTDGRYKLIYYAAGNVRQLFDLAADPGETLDLASSESHKDVLEQLSAWLRDELYGTDLAWVASDELVGADAPTRLPALDRTLYGMRGIQWPPPPRSSDPTRVLGVSDG